MKKIKAVMLVILFIAVFTVSALITVALTGSAPNRLLRVDWNEEVGTEYLNLEYEMITDINMTYIFHREWIKHSRKT